MTDFSIALEQVSKSYRLWGRGSQFATLKSALLKRDVKMDPESSIEALRNVSFVIDRGEAFGIIGRNGSGKSTLLKIISGILKPTTGNVKVQGRVAALIELGAGFHPEITGRENIFINGIMLGLSRKDIEERFDTIVAFSGIGDFIDQPVKTYSSGMYVRLGFAIAINVDPDILVVDEVLAVGDAEFQEKCFKKFADFRGAGKTVILVSHSMETVRAMCDHAAWLNHGELQKVGAAESTIAAYMSSLHTGE